LWKKMATEYKPKNLESLLTHEISMSDLPVYADKMIKGELFGRTIVSFQN
ncbi:MAG: oxidoreductase, partial [Bdellovibrionales bacterium]|nr:oxidoreductase [Bdellovibrionales bacterium]